MANNSVFISYRRQNGYPWARLIWEDLDERSIDAFLDLESMRAAGRFDVRLLNQIASRPYFMAILTEGTLDRCADEDDWMRREIEHAIETDRIIVPAFIAPFEPSMFPASVPEHIEQALCQSNGLTVYSQYLNAALNKLANELLTPVAIESAGLTDEDARFQSQAVREIQSLPAPTVPETPAPVGHPEGPASSDPAVEPGDQVPPPATTPDAGAEDPDRPEVPVGEFEFLPPDPSTDDLRAPPSSDAPVQPAPSGEQPVDTSRRRDAPRRTAPEITPATPSGKSSTRRRALVGGLAAVAVIAAIAAVAVIVGGDDEPGSAGTWLRPGDSVRSDVGDHELVMTTSGALQLRTGEQVVWAPDYSPVETASAILQDSDGNFVVYRSDSATSARDALWASGTSEIGPDAFLRVIDEGGVGSVVIEDADGVERWRQPRGSGIDPDAAKLTALIEEDRTTVDAALENWVVQLSAKRDGIDLDDGTWDLARILAEHQALRDDFGAALVDGGDYNLGLDGWYVTIVPLGAGTAEEALQWCADQGFGRDDCFAKIISDDPGTPTQSRFNP